FFDGLFRLVVRYAARADNSVTTSTVSVKQLADIDRRGLVEDVVAHRNGGGVFSLNVIGNLYGNIALGKQREEKKPVSVRHILDAAEIDKNDVALEDSPFQ